MSKRIARKVTQKFVRGTGTAAVVLSSIFAPMPAHAFFGGLGDLGSNFGSMFSSFGDFASGFGGAGAGSSLGSLGSGLGSLSSIASTVGTVASTAGMLTGNAALSSVGGIAGQAGQFSGLGSQAANGISGMAGGTTATGASTTTAGSSAPSSGMTFGFASSSGGIPVLNGAGTGSAGAAATGSSTASSGGFWSGLAGGVASVAPYAVPLASAGLAFASGNSTGISNRLAGLGGMATAANNGQPILGQTGQQVGSAVGSAASTANAGFGAYQAFAGGNYKGGFDGVSTITGSNFGPSGLNSGATNVWNNVSSPFGSGGVGGGGSGNSFAIPGANGDDAADAARNSIVGPGGVTDSTDGRASVQPETKKAPSLAGVTGSAAMRELSPLDGVTGITVDAAYRDAFMASMSSPLVMSNIVTRLTEPGVSEGTNAGLMQANSMWANRLASEIIHLKRAEFDPKIRDAVLSGRWNCIARMQGLTVEQAIQACSLTETKIHTIGSVPATAPALGAAVGGGSPATLSPIHPGGTAMWRAVYGTNANSPESAEIQDSACYGRDCLRLTDIFNARQRMLLARVNFMGPPAPGQADLATRAQAELDQLIKAKHAMRYFVGDVEYGLDKSGTATMTHWTFVPPESGKDPQEYLLAQHKARYETLNQMMAGYCEWYDGVCNGAVCNIGMNSVSSLYDRLRDRAVDGNSYWHGNPEVLAQLQQLQTQQVKIHPVVLEKLFALYRKNEHYYESGDSTDERCRGFNTGARELANFDQVRGLVDLGAGTDLKANKVPDRILTAYALTRSLATAQWIELLGGIQSAINTTGALGDSADSSESRMAQMATSLISQAAGVQPGQTMDTRTIAVQESIVDSVNTQIVGPADRLTAAASVQNSQALGAIGDKSRNSEAPR